MTRYIVKHTSRTGKTRKMILEIPKGKHPRQIERDSQLSSWPSGTRLFYESNGQHVATIITDRLTGNTRLVWHRI